jgi:hypothetical protein
MMSEDGELIPVNGEVWVDREIAIGSMLWKGDLENLPSPATAIYVVIAYSETPDIKGRVYERVVSVQRFKNSLPTVV